ECGAGTELIDLDGVVDYKFGRLKRIDHFWLATEVDDCVAHRREVDNTGNPGEILEENASGAEGNLTLTDVLCVPRGKSGDVVSSHGDAVLVVEEVLEEDADRIRQARDVCVTGPL